MSLYITTNPRFKEIDMKILVIDDAAWNVASAYQTLQGHDLTVVDSIKAAFDILGGKEQFDAVLTDLMMPIGDFAGAINSQRCPKPSGEIPAGLAFALKAANRGSLVVICTDTNHHNDWICSLLDLLYDHRHPDSAKRVAYVEARGVPLKGVWNGSEIVMGSGLSDQPRTIKNWSEAMEFSGLFSS